MAYKTVCSTVQAVILFWY